MISSMSLSPRMFRIWMKNETCFTLTWLKSFGLGARLYVTVEDDDSCWWALNIDLFLFEIYLPLFLRYRKDPKDAMEGPSWGAMLSREFGLFLYWGHKYKILEWPFPSICLERACLSGSEFIPGLDPGHENEDGKTADVRRENHICVVQDGKWRYVDATYTVWRSTYSRKGLHRLWWPKRVVGYVDAAFYDKDGSPTEVGFESLHEARIYLDRIDEAHISYRIREFAEARLI